MRIGLVGYFDVGKSYGLGDTVFPVAARTPDTERGLVGIEFPLGEGLLVDLCKTEADVVDLWRQVAVRQVTRPEMETGWRPDLKARADFDRVLEEAAAKHPIERCRLRIHAVGTAYVELRLAAGIPLAYAPGLLACFEYAAYTPEVADELLAVAERRVEDVLGPNLTGLVDLSQRAVPPVTTDAKGYAERMLFPSFTHVFACMDEGDDADAVAAAMRLKPADVVEFEYHGKLHSGWAACVLEPKQVVGWDEEGGEGESPEEQIRRMEACIRVANVFLGTCEAFMRLFETEMHHQVGGYVEKKPAGRPADELNRLRTLALAVVNLTDFSRVTPSEEDRTYFRKFDENADIAGKHQVIQQATEILYNVQVAETQDKETRRQRILSLSLGILTSLTLISVTGDAYDFIRDDESLIKSRAYRLVLVSVELMLILALLLVLVLLALRSRRGRSGGRR